jgi:hypothetical protein
MRARLAATTIRLVVMEVQTTETRSFGAPRTGPVGRAVRLLLAGGFAAALATVIDQGGPASVRDPEALTDWPYVMLTITMVAVFIVFVGELAKLVRGNAAVKRTRMVALSLLVGAAVVAAVVGAARSGAVWGSPLSDLVWALNVTMLLQTIVALLLAVVVGTPGCEIGVWGEIAARLRGRPASPPLCIIGLHHLDAWELRRRSAQANATRASASGDAAHNLERRHMSNSTERKTIEEPTPAADLKTLGDRLVGTWKISGEAEGETTWEWMEGGFFLIQRGWTCREGLDQKYLQIIGYERTPGSEPADAITGRLYTDDGDTLTYVCEVDGDTMTIWMGEKGSPAVYTGTFSADGDTIEGSWEWPGGGYQERMTRLRG